MLTGRSVSSLSHRLMPMRARSAVLASVGRSGWDRVARAVPGLVLIGACW